MSTGIFLLEMFITGVIYGYNSYASCAELSVPITQYNRRPHFHQVACSHPIKIEEGKKWRITMPITASQTKLWSEQ
jgi:hypothetical protein